MRTARFRITLPPGVWIAEVSRQHPDQVFRLLTGIETDGGAIELGEIRGPAPEEAAEAVRTHEAIHDYERLHLSGERALSRYRVEDVALYGFLRGSSIPPQFPVEVEDGAFEVEVTAGDERIRRVRANLEASGLDHELVFLVERTSPGALLTDRQREVLRAAVRLGYLEVPREAKLADLADELEVDPSTASGVLRRATARVTRWFLSTLGRR